MVPHIVDSEGNDVGTYETVRDIALEPGDILILTYDLDVSGNPFGTGKYYVTAQCYYYDIPRERLKTFSFSVVD